MAILYFDGDKTLSNTCLHYISVYKGCTFSLLENSTGMNSLNINKKGDSNIEFTCRDSFAWRIKDIITTPNYRECSIQFSAYTGPVFVGSQITVKNMRRMIKIFQKIIWSIEENWGSQYKKSEILRCAIVAQYEDPRLEPARSSNYYKLAVMIKPNDMWFLGNPLLNLFLVLGRICFNDSITAHPALKLVQIPKKMTAETLQDILSHFAKKPKDSWIFTKEEERIKRIEDIIINPNKIWEINSIGTNKYITTDSMYHGIKHFIMDMNQHKYLSCPFEKEYYNFRQQNQTTTK